MYQLLNQFPAAFQYNKHLLKFLAVEVYTCKFSNFIFNHDWERRKFEEEQKVSLKETVSIWTYINDNCQRFLNPAFHKKDGVLNVKYHITYLKFWEEYFLSWYEHTDINSEIPKSDPFDDLANGCVKKYALKREIIKLAKQGREAEKRYAESKKKISEAKKKMAPS